VPAAPAAPPRAAPPTLPPPRAVRPEHILLAAPILLFSMVAHEYAHGYAALKQGDPTAYQLGRLTWNPLKHIDPFLTIILPALTLYFTSFIFGGAKPIPVVPRNYRNFRRGDIIVSLAGIASNVAIAVASVVAVILVGLLGRSVPAIAESCAILQVALCFGVYFNILLAYFNLLPIPPLDGSHVVKHLLPPRMAIAYQNVGRYGFAVLMLVFMMARPVFGIIMAPIAMLAHVAFGAAFPYLIPTDVISNPFLGFA